MTKHHESVPKGLLVFLFVLTLAAGVFVRIDHAFKFNYDHEVFFVDKEPTFIDVDGYYYLQNAKDVVSGSYSTTDNKRAFPDLTSRTRFPSLLSTFSALLSVLTGYSLTWIAIITPVVFGLLLLVPTYLIAANFGSPLSGIFSCAAAILSFYYTSRTSLGRFDTDCLNVFFPLFVSYLFMRFGLGKSRTRYVYLAAGFFFSVTWYFWWDMAPMPVLFLTTSPLAIALIFHYRGSLREQIAFYIIMLCCFFSLGYIVGLQQIYQYIETPFKLLSYVSKQATDLFPNIGSTIEEQQRYSLATLTDHISTGKLALFLSFAGIIGLVYEKRNLCLYLLPLFIVGLLGVFWAERFLIFLNPILAIGFGYSFFWSIKKLQQKKLAIVISGIFLVYTIFVTAFTPKSLHTFFPGQVIQGMKKLKQVTEPNSLIWSWWDQGHPLVYWSDRATINDGYIHGGLRTFCAALPLATDSSRYAANFIQFYAAHGTAGINKYLATRNLLFSEAIKELETIFRLGPNSAQPYIAGLSFKSDNGEPPQSFSIDFFFPSNGPPTYLFLDSHMLSTIRTIFWWGTWDTATSSGTKTLPTFRLPNSGSSQQAYPISPDISLNPLKGSFSIRNILLNQSPFSKIISIADSSKILADFTHNPEHQHFTYLFPSSITDKIAKEEKLTTSGIYQILISLDQAETFIVDSRYADSVFFQLFIMKNGDKFFKPIDVSSPNYQIWQVLGEQ